MLFGLIILAIGALEYFNILLIPMSMDSVHFILAGIGILLVLLSIGLDKKVDISQSGYYATAVAPARI